MHKDVPLPREAASHAEEVDADWPSARTPPKSSFHRELLVHCLSPARPTTPIRSFSLQTPWKNLSAFSFLNRISGGYSTWISAHSDRQTTRFSSTFSVAARQRDCGSSRGAFLRRIRRDQATNFVWNRQHGSNSLFARPISASDISKPQLIFFLHNGTERLPKQYVPCSFVPKSR